MSRYAVKFSKTGYIKYTSHLDMLRLFKRIVKRSGIKLKYSQGFNPHPKLGFAQPLSLGYEAMAEYLEIETDERYACDDIKVRLAGLMPEGIDILDCTELSDSGKSIASAVYQGEYIIMIPEADCIDIEMAVEGYLSCDTITAMKKQKKTKQLKEIDIKPMIRKLSGTVQDNTIFLTLLCDCGSDSNLSPELVIESFVKYAGLDIDRASIEVMRKSIKMKGYSL